MNNTMKGLFVVFKKEIKDSLRDRRSLITALVPAIVGPFAMLAILSGAAENQREEIIEELAVLGQENAPDLIAHLERNNIKIRTFAGDPKQEIQERNDKVILSISADFADRFSASQPAAVLLFTDASLERSQTATKQLSALITAYSSNIGSSRLMVRGINPVVASPIALQVRDFSTRTARAAIILSVLQMIMLISPFSGGQGVAIDCTAGERERNSLEPLLVHPVTTTSIVAGKWITVVVYALFSTLIAVLSTALALKSFSLESIGIDPRLTGAMQIRVYLILIPMAFFASSVQMLASLFAKTFREAQTYLSLIALLPMIAIMATIFNEAKTAEWMYALPILGQQQLVTSVLRGEGLESIHAITTTSVTLVVALCIVVAITRLLRSERVVYGG